MNLQSKEMDKLFDAILSLKNREECYKFFEDVCTIKEIQDISQRFDVAIKLSKGENYQSITTTTGASTATISRVNKCLNYGAGGYKCALDRIEGIKDDK